MKHVWAFKYADVAADDPDECGPKHLIADTLAEATEHANQFLVDDGLRTEDCKEEGMDWQITSVSRVMKIDWPFDSSESESEKP